MIYDSDATSGDLTQPVPHSSGVNPAIFMEITAADINGSHFAVLHDQLLALCGPNANLYE